MRKGGSLTFNKALVFYRNDNSSKQETPFKIGEHLAILIINQVAVMFSDM